MAQSKEKEQELCLVHVGPGVAPLMLSSLYFSSAGFCHDLTVCNTQRNAGKLCLLEPYRDEKYETLHTVPSCYDPREIRKSKGS